MPAPTKPPITDSPWFWFSLFTAVGLSALLATGGKFGKRQANIERKYQARQWVTEGGADGPAVPAEGVERRPEEEFPEYSRPTQTLIRLKPMAISISLVLTGSLYMLVRERRRLAISEEHEPA
ncbi:MAG: hypothetical protein AAGA92_15125 [Planctomycetota bacterium]